MQLNPRYGDEPLLRLDVALDPCAAVVRQRRRLGALLAELDAEQWSTPSRCEGWSVQDVIAHLVGTNQFWALSVTAGLAGEPTRFLATFDPVASPARMVDGLRSVDSAAILAQYLESSEALAEVLDGLGSSGEPWSSVLAEAPPGHVAIPAVLAHALWDALIHERDVALPLGRVPAEEPDELAVCLRYAAALGPAFQVARGDTRRGTLGVVAVDPDCAFVVTVGGGEVVVRDGAAPDGAPTLQGRAIDLLEGLSFRTPLSHDLGDDDRWLIGGLDEVFDLTG